MLKEELDRLRNKYPIRYPWRHVKTGTVYVIRDLVYIEDGAVPAVCYSQLGVEDPIVWVRPASEFFDGRFECFL